MEAMGNGGWLVAESELLVVVCLCLPSNSLYVAATCWTSATR